MLNHSIDDMIAENVSIIPSFPCSENVIIEAVWNGSEEGTSPIECFILWRFSAGLPWPLYSEVMSSCSCLMCQALS